MIYLKQVKREALKGRITVDKWNLHKRVFQLTLKIKKGGVGYDTLSYNLIHHSLRYELLQ